MSTYKKMAEELEALLAAPPRPAPPPAPVIDESYLIAAEPTRAEETADNSHLIPQLVRSVVEYTLGRAPEGATAENIGSAISVGINEAIEHLSLDRAAVIDAAEAFLDSLSESVISSLDG